MENQASPQRIDNALEARSMPGSVASTSGTNFADLLANESNAVFVGGRRLSGISRTRYSYTEHFKVGQKVLRFVVTILKIFILVILYVIVRNIEIKQKADKVRQEWTCDMLLFYNYFLFFSTGLLLALKVTTNETLVLLEMIMFVIMVVVFGFYSIGFFVRGFYMYEDLPDNETSRAPESTFLYVVYLACYVCNMILIIILIYILCYVGLMTY